MNVDMGEHTEKQKELARQVMEPLERILDDIGVDMVFGEPRSEDEVTIIPVAEVAFGLGFGFGSGTSPQEQQAGQDAVVGSADEDTEQESIAQTAAPSEGSGGGGGGGGRTRPVGFIKVSDEGVSYEPIMDQSRIALAGIILSGWAVMWFAIALRAVAKALGNRS